MMRKWIGIALMMGFGVMLTPLGGLAQGDGLALPQPEEIFYENVEVIATGMVADESEHLVSYFHDGEWHSIPIPEDVHYASSGIVNNRPLLFMNDAIWEIDAERGELVPFSPFCGETGVSAFVYAIGMNEFGDSVELPRWVPYTDPESEDMFICSPETGEMGPRIPDGFVWFPYHWYSGFAGSISPSGEWILMYKALDNYGYSVELYGFNALTGEATDLGSVVIEGYTYIMNWPSDTQIVARSGDTGWNSQYVYTAHLDIAGSAELAAETYRDYAPFFDNPPRLETITDSYRSTEYEFDPPVIPPCGRSIYDFTTNTSSYTYTGNICTNGIIIPNGNGDRLHLLPDPVTASSVVRFNAETGIRTIIFTGEVESIEAVSPDGRFVVLALDDSGTSDFHYNDPAVAYTPPPDHSDAVLLDINTQELVYQLTDLQGENGGHPDFTWLTENQLLIKRGNRAGRLLTIDNGQYIETTLPGMVQWTGSNHEWLLVQHDGGDIWTYDLELGTETPLLRSIEPIDQWVFDETADGHLLATINLYTYSEDDDDTHYVGQIAWMIALPSGVDSP